MNFNRLRRTVEPTEQPVSVDDMRPHLALGFDDVAYDDLIVSAIDAAVAFIDGPNGIGIALCDQTYRFSLNGDQPDPRIIDIPVYPVREIVSVNWTAWDGSSASTTDFTADLDANPARIYLTSPISAKPGTIKVTFRAGFDTVPGDLKQAVMMLAGHFFANREATGAPIAEIPLGVSTILSRYRVA